MREQVRGGTKTPVWKSQAGKPAYQSKAIGQIQMHAHLQHRIGCEELERVLRRGKIRHHTRAVDDPFLMQFDGCEIDALR